MGVTALQELAEFAAGIRAPAALLDTLRMHLFDTCGALVIGGRIPEAQAGGLLEPAAAGCVRARCTEIDDIHLESCTTPGSVVVPTALTLAAGQSEEVLAEEDFLGALLAGYELMTRLGKAVNGPRILYSGIWPTYLLAGFGAAATAARLLRLGAEQTAHALAIALSMASGASPRSLGGLSSRWLVFGCAVQDGVTAARAARRGFRSDPSMLERGWRVPVDAGALVESLGVRFETARLSVKPYCSAKQATSAIAAFIQLLDEERLDPASIETVTVHVPSFYSGMIDQGQQPAERMASIVSAQYQMALGAHHRAGLRDVPRLSLRPEQDLMDRIKVEVDAGLDDLYPTVWPARVEVNGRLMREVRQANGDPGNPFTWDDAVQKFDEVTGTDRGSRLAGICRGLGETSRLPELLAEAL